MYKTIEFGISTVICRIILSSYTGLFIPVDCILIASEKLLPPCGCLSPSYQLLTDLTTLLFRVISEDNFAKQMGVSQPKMPNGVCIKIDQLLAHTVQERSQRLANCITILNQSNRLVTSVIKIENDIQFL